MNTHVVQSPEWGKVKTTYGTPAIRVGNIQFTLHKLPYTNFFIGNSPKVNPFEIDFEMLKKAAEENNVAVVNFDVPNIIIGSEEEAAALEILNKNCEKAPRDTFAKANVILDLKSSEEDVLSNMHQKRRYNIKYGLKNGVEVKEAKTQEDFDVFYNLLKSTADRQKYYARAKEYYQTIFDLLGPSGTAKIFTSYYKAIPLASWMVFIYENVLYYPYGGSSEDYKNLFGSEVLGWEIIKFGIQNKLDYFDMWGAAVDVNDREDSYYGFTNFKMKYGGTHVKYIDSYDFVLNKPVYDSYNLAQNIRWKILRLLK